MMTCDHDHANFGDPNFQKQFLINKPLSVDSNQKVLLMRLWMTAAAQWKSENGTNSFLLQYPFKNLKKSSQNIQTISEILFQKLFEYSEFYNNRCMHKQMETLRKIDFTNATQK